MGVIRPPLRVAESDGSPSVRPVNVIAFNSADFVVVDQGGATVRIDAHPGAGASLTDTQVGFGDSSNLLTGDSKFRYLQSLGQLILTGVGDDNAEFVIERSSGSSQRIGIENDSSASPKLTVSVPPNNAKPLMLESHITDTAVTGGNQGFIFNVSNTSDQSISMMTILTTDSSAYDVVFNEDSLNDYDIRMEGSTEPNLFVLKGSENNIGIGAFPSNSVERLEVVGDGSTNPMMQLRSTESGASASPHFSLYRNNTGSNNDDAGNLEFQWDNADGTKVTGAQIYAEIQTATAGSESNRLRFYNEMAGTQKEWMRVSNGIVEINAFSENIDFKVEGDSVGHINIYSDAGNDNVGVGTRAHSATRFHVKCDGSKSATVKIETEDNDADGAPTLRFHRESSSPAVQDATGQIEFSGKDLAGNEQVYSRITSHIVDPSNTSEDGDLRFKVMVAGTEREFLRMNNFGTIFNEVGIDQNFKIETVGNNKMFRVDGGLNVVAVGDDPTSGGATFQVPNNTISHYCNVNAIRSDAVGLMVMVNEDNQGQMWVHDSSSAHTINLVEPGVKGMHFQFMSTDGGITINPGGSDTLNGGTSSLARNTNYEIYDVFCYTNGKWALSNPA